MNKVIHYCWFGRNPLPDSAKRCIASWKKYFPDYEIKEWNEDNYDVNKILYTQQAYSIGKYAFVSDYARFDILYHEGGIYFDTDVEVIKSFRDIISEGPFMGCEINGNEENGIAVNPGLGIASDSGHEIYRSLLEYYKKLSFINEDGTLNNTTIVYYTTELLFRFGLHDVSGIQDIEGIKIYPKDYFCPYDYRNGVLTKTSNTHSIHWNSMTWATKRQLARSKVTRVFHKLFGNDCFSFLKRK